MNDTSDQIEYLRRAGFNLLQAEAIMDARRMAEIGHPETSIAKSLCANGFTEPEAETIARAAIKMLRGGPQPQPQPPSAAVPPRKYRRSDGLGQRAAAVALGLGVWAIFNALFSSPGKDRERPLLRTPYPPIVFVTPTPDWRSSASTVAREMDLVESPIQAPKPWTHIAPALTPSFTPPVSSADTYIPTHSGFVVDDEPGALVGAGELSISNGTSRNAICKLVNLYLDRKICSFLVLANERWQIRGIPDGKYRVLFALGTSVIRGHDRFADTQAFTAFDDPFTFTTEHTGDRTIYTIHKITLDKVIGGTARSGPIPANEFDRY